MRITDPKKCDGRDGIFKIELSNLPLTFDDELLTRSLAKLNLENFTEARVFMKSVNYAQATDNVLAVTSLNSLFMPFNVMDMKVQQPKYGVCKAIVKLETMKDCLNAINKLNNQQIEFGVRGGKLSVKLDLRIIIELEQNIYDILRPEIEKLMYVIRRDPARFFGVKVFLFGVNKSASDNARIILCGNDPKAMLLARDLYHDLTKPLILKFENKAKCKLVYKYLQRKEFSKFKCCLVHVLMDVNSMKIYGESNTRDIFKNKVDGFNKNIICYDIKATPLFIRLLRQKSHRDILKKYEESGVYINMDMTQKLVQVIYSKGLPSEQDIEMKNEDNKDDADQFDFESTKQGNECIVYLQEIMKESESTAGNENDGNNKGEANVVLCGICFMDIEENEISYQLKLCTHSFHSDCIAMQLSSAAEPGGTRPIKCATCNGNISLLDFQDILNSSEKYKQLLLFSIYDHINVNPMIYKHCPTPDCKQIYFVKDKNEEEGKDENKDDDDDDNLFNCTQCMRQYCLKCDVNYHFGLSCSAYQLSKDADKSLEEFMKKYKAGADSQKCPNCNTITDKLKHTCNHATCVYCQAHFCWKCLWMDSKNNKDGSLVYKHMKAKHGSYYG